MLRHTAAGHIVELITQPQFPNRLPLPFRQLQEVVEGNTRATSNFALRIGPHAVAGNGVLVLHTELGQGPLPASTLQRTVHLHRRSMKIAGRHFAVLD